MAGLGKNDQKSTAALKCADQLPSKHRASTKMIDGSKSAPSRYENRPVAAVYTQPSNKQCMNCHQSMCVRASSPSSE
jgi:hypothetical protein